MATVGTIATLHTPKSINMLQMFPFLMGILVCLFTVIPNSKHQLVNMSRQSTDTKVFRHYTQSKTIPTNVNLVVHLTSNARRYPIE